MAKIDYVQLEPKAFLADLMAMDTAERGAYCSLVFFLYNNRGIVTDDKKLIRQICGNPRNFTAIWKNISNKFQVSGASIVHKRVTQELQEAARRIEAKKAQTEAARKAKAQKQAKKGGSRHGMPNPTEIVTESATDNVTAVNGNGNINNNNKYSQNSDEFRLAELLLNLILERKPDYKKPNLQTWAKHIELMIRKDERTPERIEKVMRWSQSDSFWQNNILSTDKLRKQFDRLEMQSSQTSNNSQQSRLCIVCRSDGCKYQCDAKGQQVYLCHVCLDALAKMKIKSWGKYSKAQLEKLVLDGKAKRE